MRRVSGLVLKLICLFAWILLPSIVFAQPQPVGLSPWGIVDVRAGIRYFYIPSGSHSYPTTGRDGSITYQAVNFPLAVHIVTVDRRHPEYELRVLADQIDSRACSPDQLLYRTRTAEFFATTHRPAAIVAINGNIWGPSSSPGTTERQQVFPITTLVTNFDIRHMRSNSWSERVMGFGRSTSSSITIGSFARNDYFWIANQEYLHYGIGSGTSLMVDGTCSQASGETLPGSPDSYSAIGYGPRWIVLLSMDQPILRGRAGGFSTFGELCDLFGVYGVTDAILLDGGASTQMYMNSSSIRRLVNPLPTTYFEYSDARYLANAIGVVDTSNPLNPEHLDSIERNCSNGADEDGDGMVDCADVDCLYVPSCRTCVDPNCSETEPRVTARTMCIGSCSSFCNVGSSSVIQERFTRVPSPGSWVPCDLTYDPCPAGGPSPCPASRFFGGGNGVFQWGGIDLQTYCPNDTCPSEIVATRSAMAIAANACRTAAFQLSPRVFKAYYCLQDSTGDKLGPELLGPPLEDEQRPTSGPIDWSQRFLRGTLAFGRGTSLGIPSYRLHLGPDLDLSTPMTTAAQGAFARISMRRFYECAAEGLVANPPAPSSCTDECTPGLASIRCVGPADYTYCGPGFDDDPCYEMGPSDTPVRCVPALNVCQNGVGCVRCGQLAGDPCCSVGPVCSGALSCSAGVCATGSIDAGPVDAAMDATLDTAVDAGVDAGFPDGWFLTCGGTGQRCCPVGSPAEHSCNWPLECSGTGALAMCTAPPPCPPGCTILDQRDCDSMGRETTCQQPVEYVRRCWTREFSRTCPSGEVCVAGVGCRTCGGVGQPCCPGSSPCSGSATCRSGTCSTAVCSNRICEDAMGENCSNCDADCHCAAAGMYCSSGHCYTCGELGNSCCVSGSPCDFPGACEGGVCVCRDSDGDGYRSSACGGDDCNDSDNRDRPGAMERCDNLDNNCNGLRDEGLSQSCYSGLASTRGVARCVAGTQVCSAGLWGTCVGEVVPAAEICDGIDNNCDGVFDESGAATSCNARPNSTASCLGGTCRYTCNVSFGDCDGDPVNGCEVDLRSSTSHCGTCATPCSSGQVCMSSACTATCSGGTPTSCGGSCVSTTTSVSNCGTCSNACATPSNATATCTASTCGFSCVTGFGDCDGSAANGCELDLRSNNTNCGACGNACTGGRTCQASACACPAGRVPCGGTCIDIGSDANNCGSCGNICDFSNATSSCVAGVCRLATCSPGFADCDSMASNGCEANTATSISNCGGCGTRCSSAGGTPTCAMGSCRVSCSTGFADCNMNPADGCEADLQTTTTRCGSCSHACVLSNATSGCTAGICTIASCNAGFANCDVDASNGCETDINTSNSSCGSCGRTCGSGTLCSTGSCTSVCTPPTTFCSGACVSTLTDAANCGSCANGCPMPTNARAICTSGRCSGSCNAGFADCNANMTDGCEVSLSINASNCGGCGAMCTLPVGGTAICVGGRCESSCLTGQLNCAGTCRSVGGDINNCGTCGNVCPARSNSTPSCTTGTCGITCSAGFADCDRADSNGCEVILATNVANCGACGRSCTLPNANTSCSGGTCAVASCTVGFADCDRNPTNGCEVDLARDSRNCGGCGLVLPEACNGRDDNCDGRIDEGCACTDGTSRACYSGSSGTQGIGRCHGGTQTCSGGTWPVCSWEVVPVSEACNGADDDCNGVVDDLPALRCGLGECARTAPACVGGSTNVCVPGTPSAETCDGRDHNCNGVIDDGCRRLHVELAPSVQSECFGGGWYLEYYSGLDGSATRAATPGTPLDIVLPPSWASRGTMAFSAWCPTPVAGNNWRIWTSWTGQPARNAGVASILLDGVEVADTEALVCNYFPACPYGHSYYWTNPRVPLDASFNGRCEASPVACPSWCTGPSC